MVALVVERENAPDSVAALLAETPELAKSAAFSGGADALQWAREHPFDAAFLDADLLGADGIELARQLRGENPACCLIFLAATDRYALDAFAVHANGYLLRPVTRERLRGELDYFRGGTLPDKPLTVRCCGGFDVYDKSGAPVTFRRSRAKELLALLVDRRGMSVTSKEICAVFWEDDGARDQKNMAHLWQLFSELNRALRAVGAEGVVRRTGTGHYADMSLLNCPDLDSGRINRAESLYMTGYSWADTAWD